VGVAVSINIFHLMKGKTSLHKIIAPFLETKEKLSGLKVFQFLKN
jgi:hypothetical protein